MPLRVDKMFGSKDHRNMYKCFYFLVCSRQRPCYRVLFSGF